MLKKLLFNILCISVLFLFFSWKSHAQAALTGTLSWDRGNNTVEISAYKVAWGPSSSNYTHALKVSGKQTNAEIPGLEPNSVYFFAVQAIDKYGRESEFSRELAVSTPAPSESKENLLTLRWNEKEYLENHPEAKIALAKGKADSGFEYYLKYQRFSNRQKKSKGKTTLASKKQADTNRKMRPEHLLYGYDGYYIYNGWISTTDLKYEHQEAFVIKWNEYIKASGEPRLCTGDIDADGRDEVIIGLAKTRAGKNIPGGRFEVLDHDYKHLTWGKVQWDSYNKINGETWPAVGDLDGDGKEEIVIGLGEHGEGRVEIFEYINGELRHKSWAKSTWQHYNTSYGAIIPAVGDLNGDSSQEIILGFRQVNSFSALPAGRFEILSGDVYQNIAWGELSWPEYNRKSGELRPAVGDLDKDGTKEILLGLSRDGNGRVGVVQYKDYSLSHLAWIEAQNSRKESSLATKAVSGDLDRDGLDEVLIAYDTAKTSWLSLFDDYENNLSFKEQVKFWPQKNGIAEGEVWPAIQYFRE